MTVIDRINQKGVDAYDCKGESLIPLLFLFFLLTPCVGQLSRRERDNPFSFCIPARRLLAGPGGSTIAVGRLTGSGSRSGKIYSRAGGNDNV